ncbi:hypothetical protein LCGC14_2677530 [marine sediment metagenome]|uniref:Uncharacterized protein n=1 Tax=marine sediment metagenome TaxID=412755 RepID=A0A0F9CE52_9ZZZZ
MITIRYQAGDGYTESKSFDNVQAARKWAEKWVGKHPEIGLGTYAISDDGISVITAHGVSIYRLFGISPEDRRVES